ncbi:MULTISPECIES: B3/4 domain-containing protein [Streptococcus]|uniref:B3/B4 domain-containing protein n=1 Tax=Streptococcus TaxID=1301 RepID=UPI0022E23E5F|nr:phenylalanine--tRNA ligase beta subunit-related protein [Streptococcus koreensis]
MDWILNQSLVDLGIETVVIGLAKQVNPQAPLSADFLAKKKDMEAWALNCDLSSVKEEPVVQGYIDLLKEVGRSVKKNPPTILALIKNIQNRGFLPTINSVIDIYNVECLSSFLAIGGHDLDKIQGPIEFTISQREDSFLPILSTEKHVSESDPVYRDQQGIMAWLDVRDGERYKMEETTCNVLFIIQGNRATSVEMRLEALNRIREDLASCMSELEFEKFLVTPRETIPVP